MYASNAWASFVTLVAMEDAQLTVELRSLDADARLVLAVFAVVGRASLSVAELSELAGIADAGAAVADLERRGLVVREDGDRYAVAPVVQSRLKRLLASADVVDRVLRGFIDIAEDGRLTIDDLDAVVELTRIAGETGRWAELLRLAEAAGTTLSATHRIEEWTEIVERRLEAARILGDGDAAMRAEDELDRIARSGRPSTVSSSSPGLQEDNSGRGLKTALAVLGALALGAAGVAVGYVAGDRTGESDTATLTETESVTVTVTEEGGTVTVTETVVESATETVTETLTETETVTVTEQPVG